MSTVAEHVPFLDLCRVCEKMASKTGKDKYKPLNDFINQWREFHTKLHAENPQTKDSFYPALRLLLPHCERERAAYGIKEYTLGKLFVSVLSLDKNSPDAQKLMNCRSPKVVKADAGDFASVAYFILKKRCPGKSSLKISDVNNKLDRISTSNTNKSKDEVITTLRSLVINSTALEQKWLIRMILKDMKLGASENSVLNAYHEDAKDLYNVTSSLEKVSIQLRDPKVRLHEIEISIFMPFRPMLGEQVLPDQIEKLMKNQPFVIEKKYDGERLQLHKQGNQYKYFTRNCHEVTHVYGANPHEGKLTQHISQSFKPHITDCILDGEIVIYSNKMNCIVSKGENPDVQALEPDGDYQPCFCVFDVLLVNGKVLSNLPLIERAAHIRNIFTPIENKIRSTEQKSGSTNEDVANALNEAIDNHDEGIVVKSIESKYRPNLRKGSGWFKVKPDYIDNLMDELDLLIIGGYFGEGRRANIVSHFLLGVSEPVEIPGEKPKAFLSVAQVGSGYSDKELRELLEKLTPHWQKYDPKKPPPFISIGIGASRKERPHVCIEPSKSHVVQVRAAEIIRSEKFATNYTLRFPRVQKIRYDKSWHDCMTAEEFTNLRQQSDGRLANHYQLPENEEPSPKKPRKLRAEHIISVAPQYRPTNLDDVEQKSELFQGKEICVMSLQNKDSLERAVAEHGGKCVQNPGSNTFCILSDKLTLKGKNLTRTNQYNIVKDSWLNKCIEKNEIVPWVPSDMHHAVPKTLRKLREHFDEFGDSFTENVTAESLGVILRNMECNLEENEDLLTPKEIADLEFRYFSSCSPYGLFRTCCVYVDDKEYIGNDDQEVNFMQKVISSKLKLFGADVRSSIENDVTHVIVLSIDSKRLKELKNVSKSRKSGRFHIVTEKWVERSIRHKNLQPERSFHPTL